ncbi:hypothetical protein NP493_636g03040 [Ridgeia piscesae]|uniref:Guanylate cyclase domain-containing protein n=1 Tax=Ridgeia piscesae TaxID=27915 RepID=A0AAD9NNG7_RIDPI|nr:hypothetical protein NP493_636g03040 [Ridgeia piscesae]
MGLATWFLVVTLAAQPGAFGGKMKLKVGLITPPDGIFGYSRIAAATTMAVEDAKKKAAINAGKIIAYWNLPFVSFSSVDPALADREMYNTLIRLMSPHNEMAEAMSHLFHFYGWKSAVVVSSQVANFDMRCEHLEASVRKTFNRHNIALTLLLSSATYAPELSQWLERIKVAGRIVILCGDTTFLTDVMMEAHRQGMTSGDYVFINPTLIPYNDVEQHWENITSTGGIPKETFWPLLRMSVRIASENREFIATLPHKMALPPWNHNDTLERKLVEMRRRGYSPRNGTMLVEMATTKTFKEQNRRRKLQRELDLMLWKINYEDLVFVGERQTSSRLRSQSDVDGDEKELYADHTRCNVNLALYKGDMVVARTLCSGPLVVTRSMEYELKTPDNAQSADVYSFAIVVYETLYRRNPYEIDGNLTMSPEDIILQVGENKNPPFRPIVPDTQHETNDLMQLMVSCWAEKPRDRPDFNSIKKSFANMNAGKYYSIIDNMLRMMETYTSDLEDAIARHAAEMANMALNVLSSVMAFKIRHRPDKQLQVRIGLHSGAVVTAMRIHMSVSTRDALLATGDKFIIRERGEVELKGKGFVTSYWLNGKEGYPSPLPYFED